ncbi:MAG: ThiF family adenylyltransferase [Candidatus Helarchaeota archaeon]
MTESLNKPQITINENLHHAEEKIAAKIEFLKNDRNFLNKIHDRQFGCITKTWKDMAKIALTKVCCCGLGALGITSEMLTRFGFGYGEKNGITVVDMDVYDESNFVRQYGARTESIGVSKATYTRVLLQQLGLARVRAIHAEVSPDNVDDLIKDANLVIHTIDGIKGAIALAEACRRKGILAIEGWGLMFNNAIVHHPDGPTWTEAYGVTDFLKDKDVADLTRDEELQITGRVLSKLSRIPGLAKRYDEKSIELMKKTQMTGRTSVFIWGTAHQLLSEAVKNVLGFGVRSKAPIMHLYDPFTLQGFRYDLMREQIIP